MEFLSFFHENIVFYATVPIASLFQAQLSCDPHQYILRFPSEK